MLHSKPHLITFFFRGFPMLTGAVYHTPSKIARRKQKFNKRVTGSFPPPDCVPEERCPGRKRAFFRPIVGQGPWPHNIGWCHVPGCTGVHLYYTWNFPRLQGPRKGYRGAFSPGRRKKIQSQGQNLVQLPRAHEVVLPLGKHRQPGPRAGGKPPGGRRGGHVIPAAVDHGQPGAPLAVAGRRGRTPPGRPGTLG